MVQSVDTVQRQSLLDALSTGWIERTLGVSRAAISDWRRGRFPERRQQELDVAIRDLLPDTTKEAPPWAEPLVADLSAIRSQVDELVSAVTSLPAVLAASTSPTSTGGDDLVDDPEPVTPR